MKRHCLAKDIRWEFVGNSDDIVAGIETIVQALSVIATHTNLANPHDVTDSLDSIYSEAIKAGIVATGIQEKIAELANATEQEIQSEYTK